MTIFATCSRQPWNKGKLVGQKAPLRLRDIWAIRIFSSWTLVVGLLAFSAWRVLQATRDVDHHGKELKGVVIRTGLFAGGLVNAALAFFCNGSTH